MTRGTRREGTYPLSHCAIHPAGSFGSVGSVGPESGDTGGWGGVGAAMFDGRTTKIVVAGKENGLVVLDVEGAQYWKVSGRRRLRTSRRALIWRKYTGQRIERWAVLLSGL